MFMQLRIVSIFVRQQLTFPFMIGGSLRILVLSKKKCVEKD